MRAASVLTVLTSILLLSADPEPARAGATFEASIDPPFLTYPATRTLSYRLEITSDAEGAKLVVLPSPPRYVFRKSQGLPGTFIGGSPVIAAGAPTYVGAGTAQVTPKGFTVVDYGGPSEATPGKFRTYPSVCFRGYDELAQPYAATVTLPPNSKGSLLFPYRTGRVPPWRGGDYRLKFQIDSIAGDPPVPPSLSGAPEFRAPSLPLGRGRGVFIRMQVARHRTLQDGRVGVVIRGTTRPRLRRQEIEIRAAKRQTPAWFGYRSAGRLPGVTDVTTDEHGRFKTILPAEPNTYYTVASYYRSQGHRLADDRSCPLRFYSG